MLLILFLALARVKLMPLALLGFYFPTLFSTFLALVIIYLHHFIDPHSYLIIVSSITVLRRCDTMAGGEKREM